MSTSQKRNCPAAVDIALATCNGESYLKELLDSIEQQTHGHWHLTAGDDGSSDGTAEILKRFAEIHPTRTTLLTPSNRVGAKANFARVLQACESDYILLADQDDVWFPHKIERCLKLAQAVEMETPPDTPIFIHSDAAVTDENLNILNQSLWRYQNLRPKYGLKFKNLLVQNVITGCSVLVNRALLERTLPIPGESIMHDWWMGLAAAAFGKIGYITEPTLFYRQHANNQIGAKRWSALHIAGEAASGIKALKKRIEATQRQAAVFKTRFDNHLKKEDQDILNIYLQLNRCGPIRKRLLAAHNRLHKCGFARTVGFYAAL